MEKPGPLSPEANARLLALFDQLSAEQRDTGQTTVDGQTLVHRTVVLPGGHEGGLACTPERSAELSDEDIVRMIQERFPDEG